MQVWYIADQVWGTRACRGRSVDSCLSSSTLVPSTDGEHLRMRWEQESYPLQQTAQHWLNGGRDGGGRCGGEDDNDDDSGGVGIGGDCDRSDHQWWWNSENILHRPRQMKNSKCYSLVDLF